MLILSQSSYQNTKPMQDNLLNKEGREYKSNPLRYPIRQHGTGTKKDMKTSGTE
jgi:hypothetical protein